MKILHALFLKGHMQAGTIKSTWLGLKYIAMPRIASFLLKLILKSLVGCLQGCLAAGQIVDSMYCNVWYLL